MRAGHGQNRRVALLDETFLCAKAAGDDHLAVLPKCLANGAERFLYCGVDEAAGVDDYEICILVIRRSGIALSTQLGEDALRIDERLRTA
jgi:hypothetical protein